MRGRSKRIKRSVLSNRGSGSGSGGYTELNGGCHRIPQFEAEESVPGESSQFDGGCFAARCSVRLLHEVVSNLGDQKRQLVRDIGFDGILHFPAFKQFNRKFVMWLMTSVDERSSSLKILEHINIRITKNDVANVLGIPSSGLVVRESVISSRDAKDFVILNFLGQEFKEHRSIKFVQDILSRDYACPMSKEDMDRWKVAFVVFVASSLLCPSSKYDYASIDYWNAIQCPEKIRMFDWSEYVLETLLDGVAKLKHDISTNIKFPNITGCAIFLMVFYLDSLDLGSLSSPHSSLPRVKEFDHERIRAMISADMNFSSYLKDGHPYLVSKLRPSAGCIYSWSISGVVPETEQRTSSFLALWECAVAMVHLLNIPLEAAGPLFVAAADFQEEINRGFPVGGTQAIKFMTVLLSILLPFRRGFSYHPDYLSNSNDRDCIETSIVNGISLLSQPLRLKVGNCTGTCNAAYSSLGGNEWTCLDGNVNSLCSTSFGDNVQSSFRQAACSLNDTPQQLNVDIRVSSAMSQFYSIIRRLKPPLGFDLNSNSVSAALDVGSSSTIMPNGSGSLPSPWVVGFRWPSIQHHCPGDMAKLVSLGTYQSNVVLHCSPRRIQVAGSSFVSQFNGESEFDSDLLDALVRSLRQQDDCLYEAFGKQRWRHYFESDLMDSVLSGNVDCSGSSLRHLLSFSSVCYDLSTCKYFFFPALLHCRWVCFVWSPDANVLSVFEPSFSFPVPEERIQVIHRACFLLKLVLQSLVSTFNLPTRVDVATAETRLLTLSRRPNEWINRSGLICSVFMRCFDGVDLHPCMHTLETEIIVLSLYNELASLKDNMAQFTVLSN